MKKTLAFLASVCFSSMLSAQWNYPETRRTDQTDTYFSTVVPDPYRWLEDDRSAETGTWVTAQNKTTDSFLQSVPFRSKLKERLTGLWNFAKSSTPFKGGKNYFVYRNDGLQNQFVLNILRTGPQSKPEVFLDPNTLSKDGTVNVSALSVSHDGRYMAYAISKAGSDWEEIYIKNTTDGGQLNDKLEWVKFSGIAWKNGGFYYSRYDAPPEGDVLKAKNEFQKIYFHTAGTPQKNDQLIYEDKNHPNRNFSASTSDDGQWLYIFGSEGTSGNNLVVKNLNEPLSGFVTLIPEFENDNAVIGSEGTKVFVLTNKNASNYQLIQFDASMPDASPVVIIPQSEDVLQAVSFGYDKIVAQYLHDATNVLKVFSKEGKFLYDVPLATLGTIDQISTDKKDSLLFYALNTFTAPPTIYQFNLKSKEQEIFFQPKVDFNPNDYETKQIFYTSKDSTKVPMFIVYKKGILLDGNNPTLMFGYGGFNVSKTPEFKIERLIFLENGGVFAQPNIRGGGEYGEAWHEAGTKLKKQNVFDDYIAAAQYLINEKYTNPTKLAISGRSNGGLLVGAVMTQRPDLFKVALPTVGVMDMLRYHKFTIGWAWKSDYGSSEDSLGFRNLYSYSPLHNIRTGVNYPATLVITGDHDDRVVPAHSFKFISTLQYAYKGPNPVMIRIDVNSGHAAFNALGSSKPVAKQIDEQSDIFSFLMYNLGMTVK